MAKMKTGIVCVLGFLLVLSPGLADAQRGQSDEPPEPMYRIPGTAPEPDRTQRQTGLTERTFNLLTSIHEDIGNEMYAEAQERLAALLNRSRINDYERALIHQNLGFVYAVTEQYDRAIASFQDALRIDSLPHSDTQDMFLMLGQMYGMEEDWARVLSVMRRYFYWEEDPSADSLILMASAYASRQDYGNGIVWVQRAIKASNRPRENWYQLWLAMHFERKEYAEAADVLAQMISLWPDKPTYWEQLAGMLSELGRDDEALAVLSIAYQRNLLDNQTRLVNLARYYLYHNVPYNAARILSKGMEDGIIERTKDNVELLAMSYQNAQETEAAIRATEWAASLDEDGELYVRAAQMYASMDDWDGVQRATRAALDKGGLKNPGRAWMMIGMAAYENDQIQEALRAFRQARDYPDERERASSWIQYINNELRIERELRQGF